MSALFIYLLKANIALCLFYLAYRLGLRRMTFYTLNRFFLLGGIAFSSMFPLVDVNDFFSRNESLAQQVITYVPDWSTLQQVEAFTVWTLLEWTFWAGVAVMAIRLLVQLGSLLVLHLRTEPDRLFDQEVRRMKGSLTPFSFFRKIYVNPDLHSESELYSIVKHEQVHVKEWHTADIMMGEVNNVFYWFNPGAWLMKGAIRENLEFLADRAILRSGINRKEYQYSLIQVNASQHAAGITNSFNLSHIKNRIFMMNKSRTSGIQLYRYGLLGTLVCALLLTLNYTRAGAAVQDAIEEVRTVLIPETAQEKDTVPAKKSDTYITVTGKSSVGQDTFYGKPAIVGKVSGVQVTGDVVERANENWKQKEGRPQTAANIILRNGDTTRKPLFVLDGVVLSNAGNINPLKDLDPNDIESIAVLKDQASSALYGRAGNNGVIIITTKKGGNATSIKSASPVEYVMTRKDSGNTVTVTGYRLPSRGGAVSVERDSLSKVYYQKTMEGIKEKEAESIHRQQALQLHYSQHSAAVSSAQKKQENSNELYVKVFEDALSRQFKADSIAVMRGQSKTGHTIGTSMQSDYFPNPTSGIVTLSYGLARPGKGYIRVTDINGKAVYEKSINGLSGTQKEQINLSNQPAGMYILLVVHDGSTMTSRIVKQ